MQASWDSSTKTVSTFGKKNRKRGPGNHYQENGIQFAAEELFKSKIWFTLQEKQNDEFAFRPVKYLL